MQMALLPMWKIPKNLQNNLPEFISEFIKVTGYKIQLQKSVVFPYSSNVHNNTEI